MEINTTSYLDSLHVDGEMYDIPDRIVNELDGFFATIAERTWQ